MTFDLLQRAIHVITDCMIYESVTIITRLAALISISFLGENTKRLTDNDDNTALEVHSFFTDLGNDLPCFHRRFDRLSSI